MPQDEVRVVIGASAAPRPLRAVRNLLDAADLPVRVEVVCFADGIDLVLREGTGRDAVAGLQALGVRFLACANTVEGRGLTPEALLDGVELVPAAVWHLARRQHEGWSHLPM